MKPIVLVTCNNTFQSNFAVEDLIGGPGQEWHLLAHDYIRELERANATALVMPVYRETCDLQELLTVADGFLFTGGRNTDPSYYGEEFSASVTSNNPYRDQFEYELGKEIIFHSDVPVLGICRGIQILNIAAGGSSYVDTAQAGMYHKLTGTLWSHPTHWVDLAQGSRIRSIWDKPSIKTNSLHSQGVKQLGKGMIATGVAKDGLVEIIEQDNPDRFFIATQFHPEMMAPVHAEFSMLFQAFVSACTEYHEKKK